ncbi:MAG: DUF4156 domain-containing protein [Deltaproteobacteria bacterium]|nr:DUF4156 domain-containing protein [Deltaproteobacteria bacterium]
MTLRFPTARGSYASLGALTLGLAMLFQPGCKASQLTSHGTDVALLGTEPFGCEELGEVVAHGGGAGGGYVKKRIIVESATTNARNQAAEMGATHVLLGEPEIVHGTGTASVHDMQPAMAHGDGSSSTATVRGVAYKCDPGAVPAVIARLLPEIKNPPAVISMLPLGKLERILVYQRNPATPDVPASEIEVLRLEDQADIQEVAESLMHLALDPMKYIPTHRVEIVGELGTQSLLYGFGYLEYAGKTYRLTTGTFETTLQLVESPKPDAQPTPGPEVESEPLAEPEPTAVDPPTNDPK